MKTYFVSILSSFIIVKGQIQNFSKNNSFPLTDYCIDKRILVWGEPHFPREEIEIMKLLFSGDSQMISFKLTSIYP